jgi:altronate hydrolase
MSDQESLTIRLHAADNVIVVRTDLLASMPIEGEGIETRDHIPAGHKIATAPISAGEAVRKYDQIIGFARADIAVGEHVHTHNVEVRIFDRDPRIGEAVKDSGLLPDAERATFEGIVRPDGRVGTRNYIGIMTTVNCSGTVARYIADHFRGGALDAYPNVDGVVAFRHGTGCGMASDGAGMELFSRTVAGYLRHPNFAGMVLVGLGCEAAQIAMVMQREGVETNPLLHAITIQDTGGTTATVKAGIEKVEAMLPAANEITRQTVSASHLVLGMECGGSDAFSGITANPALGAAADLLVRHGGTAILGETPEIYGAEHLLTRRAVST